MSLRSCWELTRRAMTSYAQARAFFWALALGWMMGPLVYLFVWMTAARQGATGGYSQDDFIVYYLCLIIVNQLTYPNANWTVGDVIRGGYFSTWLLHPLPVIYEAISADLGGKLVCTPFAVLVAGALGLLLRPAFAITWLALLSFIVALALAGALRFTLAYALALTAFWSERADALLRLNDTLLFLLAGQVAPTALLPGMLQRAANVLPYRYMLGFPIELFLGRLSRAEVMTGFAWQVGWLGFAVLLQALVYRRGVRRYSAIGG